ncbi:methyltransferase family protein [Lentibacter algarum]|uniref:methyltransferase family protein n=1 Tax=Lentibacter algarum TaxID=576131 RepID=UPI0020905FE3|nr:isoprenylcysteine carboxylmethyltransferase family protein [Lentibacter algarum]
MNQKIRIYALRVYFIVAMAAVIFTQSEWQALEGIWELPFEIIEVTGILLVVAGVLGRFWAILYIGGRKNQEVMQFGPYSICRHPLYLFSTLGALGFGLMLGSLVLTVLIGGGIYLILSMTAAREEAFLRAEFGTQYEDYAARVPRIWPNTELFKTPRTAVFDTETLRGNLLDAFVFLALIPLAELVEYMHEVLHFPTIPIW